MRKNTKKTDFIIIAVIMLLIAGGILSALLPHSDRQNENAASADTNGDGKLTYTDYIGKRVGIVTGSSFEDPTFEYLPESEYLYYDSLSDIILALKQGKIDCFIYDEPILRMAHIRQPEIGYLDDVLREDDYSFAVPKNSEKADRIIKQFNEMLSSFASDGTLEKMKDKWFSEESEKNRVDLSGLNGTNGTLKIVTVSTNVPFSMISDGELTGYSIELIAQFCRRYGYDCSIDQTNVSSALAGISTGIYDILASCATVTDERKESMGFSDPIYVGGISLAVRTSDIARTNVPITEDTPLSYFNDKRIGILTGSVYESVAQKLYPDAEYVYYDVASDLALATAAGKIDGYLMSIEQAETMTAENPTLFWLKETAGETPYAFGFAKTEKGAALRDKINEFLDKIKADGTMDALLAKWKKGDIEQSVDLSGFTGENGTLDVACAGTTPPWEYTYNGEVTGYEIELVSMFCREYGYTPNFDTMTFSAIIPGISSEKYDMAAANLSVTPERAESIYFSDKQSGSDIVFVTASAGTEGSENAGNESFFESMAGSFEKNFIREDRWKLILEGIGTTCLITVLSAIFGSVLAFLICMFRRTGSPLANAISNICVKLLQGTPIVVLLMILYYVILGKTGLEAVWVAIIGFTLNFGAYASEIMRSGIESIDGGQREAALALGYNENQAFFRFIFPQAAVRFIPVYKQEIVSLLKSTSIVGYIAIQDLTKMSDIIRSRTYEAFFPLIATAVIYFVLAWVISLILKLVLKAFDKRSKKGNTAK